MAQADRRHTLGETPIGVRDDSPALGIDAASGGAAVDLAKNRRITFLKSGDEN